MVHGEAVAVGMALAARISVAAGECSDTDRSRIAGLLDKIGLSTTVPSVDGSTLRAALSTDKKNRSGTITFILNRGIGSFVMKPYSPDELLTMCGLEV